MIRFFPLLLLLCACTPSVPPDWPLPQWRVHGAPVVYEAATLPAHASAQIRGGICFVSWDPDRWDPLAPSVRVFIIAHEIAHCELASAPLSPHAAEYAADCRAVQWMHRAGYLSASWLATLCAAIMDWPGSATHPSGPDRVMNILECAP